jgi:hypothetical protein
LRNPGFLVQTAISLIFYPFIQELTKEQYHSYPYLFSVSFTHPLITHDIGVAEYSPWDKNGNRAGMMESKKDIRVQGPSRVFGITTVIIALIHQWLFQNSIMRIIASFLILNDPEQFL